MVVSSSSDFIGESTSDVSVSAELPWGGTRGWSEVRERLSDHRLALVGLGIVVVLAGFCFVGPIFYHTNQINSNLAAVNLPPGSADHPLGTDSLGYDQLGRLMAGGQVSLEVGLAAGILATVIGALWGAAAGYFGGIVDALLMRVVDAMLSLPALFVLLAIGSVITPSVPSLIVLIGLIAWLVPARLVRGETLSLRMLEYVQAVKVMGGTNSRTIVRHILPNAIGTVLVNASFQVADAILYLAYLSYLGLGLSPPATDWGGMLSSGLSYTYAGYWWLIYPPGVLIVLIVLGFNFLGDGLRDWFDPRLEKR